MNIITFLSIVIYLYFVLIASIYSTTENTNHILYEYGIKVAVRMESSCGQKLNAMAAMLANVIAENKSADELALLTVFLEMTLKGLETIFTAYEITANCEEKKKEFENGDI